MSADNWTKCPKCMPLRLKERDKIHQLYGRISEQEYSELLRKQQKTIESEDDNTLREDYKIGIFDGVFTVSYFGYCSRCGFEKQFSHKEQIEI